MTCCTLGLPLPITTPISASQRGEEVFAPPCHVENPFWRDEEVFAPPCHVENPFRRDEEVFAPPCQVEILFWRDEEVRAPSCHVGYLFLSRSTPLHLSCRGLNNFQYFY